jgi:hypothetical protein
VELGEVVNVAIPEQKMDRECPFAHKKPEPPKENELGGIGTKLGDNMRDGIGIHKSKPPIGADYVAGSKEPDPRDRKKKLTYTLIEVDDERVELDDGTPVPYPVTCAAHHLIPAQESLKGHPVLTFMCTSWDEQDFRKGGKADKATVSDAKVWGNVAYNVNGCQNGVWLPGNYAVGAATGGIEAWKSRKSKRKGMSNKQAAENWEDALDLAPEAWAQLSADPEEDEKPQPGSLASALAEAVAPEYMLVGKNYHISTGNPKWGYVKGAMDGAGGQFHDRHGDYSRQVKKYLTKIYEVYEDMYNRSTKGKRRCQKCAKAERPDEAKDTQVGPPYNIVTRLKNGGEFFKKFLVEKKRAKKLQWGGGGAKAENKNIYTSKWVLEWMKKS